MCVCVGTLSSSKFLMRAAATLWLRSGETASRQEENWAKDCSGTSASWSCAHSASTCTSRTWDRSKRLASRYILRYIAQQQYSPEIYSNLKQLRSIDTSKLPCDKHTNLTRVAFIQHSQGSNSALVPLDNTAKQKKMHHCKERVRCPYSVVKNVGLSPQFQSLVVP